MLGFIGKAVMKKIQFSGLLGPVVLLCMAMVSSCANAVAAPGNQPKSRTLVVYFSQPEDAQLDGVDAVSGASLLQKNNEILGSTQYVAQLIQKQTGGDLFRIETVTSYPRQHDALLQYAEQEQKNGVHPDMKTKIQNLSDYDTIFVGYPIWWYKMPMVLYSFFEQYDFSGKTIIPFTTHGGSRFADSLSEIQRLQPNATLITDGLAVSRGDVADDDTPGDVSKWLGALPRKQ
jgi:flavodoxin